MGECPFCNFKTDKKGTFLFENEYCICIELNEPILIGSCMIIPKAHKENVFDLDINEWKDTKQLIDKVKQYLDTKYNPDGYNLGWNCGKIGGQHVFHAHLHIMPRYSDEPFAGKGIRNLIKSEENRRQKK